jgi:hypothetical protein
MQSYFLWESMRQTISPSFESLKTNTSSAPSTIKTNASRWHPIKLNSGCVAETLRNFVFCSKPTEGKAGLIFPSGRRTEARIRKESSSLPAERGESLLGKKEPRIRLNPRLSSKIAADNPGDCE